MQTRSQTDATRVHTQIVALTKEQHTVYGRLCNRFPIMVLQNGLTQALGFIAGKAGTQSASAQAFACFGNDVAHLLADEDLAAFMPQLLSTDLAGYQRLTRRALAVSLWQKRFAESVLGIGPDDGGQDDAAAA